MFVFAKTFYFAQACLQVLHTLDGQKFRLDNYGGYLLRKKNGKDNRMTYYN